MPGTVVAIGRYGPRIPSGAAGFKSQVSRWLGPPHSKMKMHDFSAATPRSACLSLTLAATIPGKARFNARIPPAWRSRRREIRLDDRLVTRREVAMACLWRAGGGIEEQSVDCQAASPFRWAIHLGT